MRTIIDLPDELSKNLDKVLKQKNISRAEAIRTATEQWLRVNQEDSFINAFGILQTNPITDQELESLRGEWGDESLL